MPYAQYEITTGAIHATVGRDVQNDALAKQGLAQLLVEDGVTGATHRINLQTLKAEPLPPPEEGTIERFMLDWPHEKIVEFLKDSGKQADLIAAAEAVE